MSEITAFEALRQLAERSQQVAVQLPAREHAQSRWQGLGFSLLGERFVVPLSEVSEIMRIPAQATRLPGVQNFVMGVSNVRGRLLIVVDLALFFGEPSSLPRGQRRILAIENDENYLGFMVDESLGMQHFPSESYTTEPIPELHDKIKGYIAGSYAVGGVNWPVMSLIALANDPGLERFAA
ncbi:MAG: chemotaxis protein CheW [Pseudomonadota bacterium]